MSPLEPKWSHLRSIIPNVLQLSVIGYPFINPGPVGGIPPTQMFETPATNSTSKTGVDLARQLQEDLELYVRWWQLNTFLPMIHFVKPPTAFPDSAVSYWIIIFKVYDYVFFWYYRVQLALKDVNLFEIKLFSLFTQVNNIFFFSFRFRPSQSL
jgi:hypothetical protein